MNKYGRPQQDDDNAGVDDVDADVAAAMAELRAGNTGDQDNADTGTADETDAQAGDKQPARGETEQQRQARERDERGRFAEKKPEAKPADATADKAAPAAADPAAPPSSWSVKSKAAWANLPADVKADIAKREGEVANGLRALADYKDLAPYAQQAAAAGTSIRAALDHYTGFDKLLQKDMAGGLAVVAESYGYRTREQLGQLFSGLAQRYGAAPATAAPGTPSPTAQPGNEDDALQQVLAPILKPLLDKIAGLEQNTTARVEADRNAHVQTLASAIQTFAADPKNIYFANVEADIERLFRAQMVPLTGNHAADLQAAYDMAVRMNPDTHATLIEQQAVERQEAKRRTDQDKADKAKAASRSLGGSKLPGTIYKDAADSGDNPEDDVEADVRRAFRQHASA